MLITDGKTQSAQFDEYAYHESLVHPALLKFASSLDGAVPKTVFIGGGGELATAREVLRHNSVERVVMVDLDEKVVEVCKQYLPEWGGEAVLKDPRFELVIGDAHAYLLETQETFDVIIMDISDPIEAGPGVMLYTKELYEHALTRLNKPHGVFVTQAGTAESIPAAGNEALEVDPSCYSPIYNTLKSAFDCVVPYSTNIPSYGGDWGFIMAFQNPMSDGSNAGAVGLEEDWKVPPKGFTDVLIENQIIGGPDALSFYDGITHLSMFALSKPLRKFMKKDNRIMTRDNPIFMY
jgi:spermidine synthase